MIELKRLKNKQSNYLPIMNQSTSLPTFPVSTISSTGPKLFLPKNQNGIRSHTGVYKRSERTNWELAWSCCLNSSLDSPGCTLIKNTKQSNSNKSTIYSYNNKNNTQLISTSSSGLLSNSNILKKRPKSASNIASTSTFQNHS